MRAAQVQVRQGGAGASDGGLVDAAQVVGGQRRTGATGNAVAAAGPGKHEIRRVAAGGELARDSRANLLAHRDHAYTGWALRLRLEATAELTGLVEDLDHLYAAQLGMHPPPTQTEQLAAAQAGAHLGDEMVAVEWPTGGKEPAELLRRECVAALVAENLVRIDAQLWRLDA